MAESNHGRELETRLRAKNGTIGIVGLGYVGLPLAVELAKAGFTVLGYDVQQNKVDRVNQGESYIGDVHADTLKELVEKKKLRATSSMEEFRAADAIIICVPTPLNRYREPDISYVETSARDVRTVLQPNQLVVLESTTYPGTTEEVVLPILKESGLNIGKDFFLAFSPERVDPGNKVFNTGNTPKVVGGVTDRCTELATLLYASFLPKVISVSSPRVAEMEKLLENIFRIVNVSMINEMALLAKRMGIDIWEVIEAASTKPYGFMPFYPGPGIGGHCIPIDPFYLSWKARQYNYSPQFIELAGQINEQMPEHVVTMVTDALNADKKPMLGSSVLVLGVAYKRDISDVRESPALRILQLLRQKGAKAAFHDHHVPSVTLDDETLHSVPLTDDALHAADCVLILTDHSHLDHEAIAQKSRLVVDTRNAVKNRGLKHVHRL